MALKAGYVGIKNRLMLSLQDKLLKLDNIIPAGASGDNPLATDREIRDIWGSNNILGAKNLLSSTPTNIHTANSTINSDGSITLSGAISNDIVIQFSSRSQADAMILSKDVSYILSIKNAIEKIALQVGYTDPVTGNYVQLAQSGMGASSLRFTSPVDAVKWTLQLVKQSSVTNIEEVTLYPMLRLAADPDDTYEPYAMTNQQLTAEAATLESVDEAHKTVINGIIAAATGAADFAAFKTAMGALTPLTRSAGNDQRSVLEVEEDPEPEVTTKSTRKSTK